MPYYRFRGQGQITSGETRSGHGFQYGGRRILRKGDNFQLTWNGPAVTAAILDALTEAFAKLSNDALEYMQSIVPYKTSRLHDSCFATVQTQGGRIYLVIGADTPYAIYVELGTARNAAQPYIRPTFDMIIRELPGIVRAEVQSRARG